MSIHLELIYSVIVYYYLLNGSLLADTLATANRPGVHLISFLLDVAV